MQIIEAKRQFRKEKDSQSDAKKCQRLDGCTQSSEEARPMAHGNDMMYWSINLVLFLCQAKEVVVSKQV